MMKCLMLKNILVNHLDPQIILDRVYGLLIDKKDNRIFKTHQLFETQPG